MLSRILNRLLLGVFCAGLAFIKDVRPQRIPHRCSWSLRSLPRLYFSSYSKSTRVTCKILRDDQPVRVLTPGPIQELTDAEASPFPRLTFILRRPALGANGMRNTPSALVRRVLTSLKSMVGTTRDFTTWLFNQARAGQFPSNVTSAARMMILISG